MEKNPGEKRSIQKAANQLNSGMQTLYSDTFVTCHLRIKSIITTNRANNSYNNTTLTTTMTSAIPQGGGNYNEFVVKRFTALKQDDSVTWSKGVATIHSSLQQTSAWLWHYCSNHRIKNHQKREGNILRQHYVPPKRANEEDQRRTNYLVVRQSMPTGTYTRETSAKYVWGSFNTNNENLLAIGFEPVEKERRYVTPIRKTYKKTVHLGVKLGVGMNTPNLRSAAITPITTVSQISTISTNKVEKTTEEKVVQILTKGVWIIKPIAPNACEATLVQRVKDTGKIPKKVLNMHIGRTLNVIFYLKGYFERNGVVVDKELRNEFVRRIPEAIVTNQLRKIVEEQVRRKLFPLTLF